jgi:hypothetical protein
VVSAKYGVIVCPKCGMARGVETAKKTTTCQCGKEIHLDRVKTMFLTDSPIELADSVAAANASLRGGERMPREKSRRRDPLSTIAERAKSVKDPVERLQIIARGLTDEESEFGLEDLRKIVSRIGKGSPEDMLAALKEHNLVYETSDGKYRAV